MDSRLAYMPSPAGLSSPRLPDGLTRRGDINLLMLGDPGTAKSQLLKFVEKCSPIGVSVQDHLCPPRLPCREEGCGQDRRGRRRKGTGRVPRCGWSSGLEGVCITAWPVVGCGPGASRLISLSLGLSVREVFFIFFLLKKIFFFFFAF